MKQPEKCKINKNSFCLYPIEECDNCPNNIGDEKIKVVIDIPKENYKNILNGFSFQSVVFDAIKKGKPLPEKHGRLIDLDELFKKLNSEKIPVIEDINYILRHAPVIIETTGAAVQEEIKNDIDPDIKNLFDALNKIKNICESQKRCDNCIFYKKSIDCCLFEEGGCLFKTPERWEI